MPVNKNALLRYKIIGSPLIVQIGKFDSKIA